jgi:hypothetical protein
VDQWLSKSWRQCVEGPGFHSPRLSNCGFPRRPGYSPKEVLVFLTSSAVIADFSDKWPVAYLWITQGAGKKGMELWVWAESKATIYRTQLGSHTRLMEEMRPGGQMRAFVKGSIAFKSIISAVDLDTAVLLRTKRTHWGMIAS